MSALNDAEDKMLHGNRGRIKGVIYLGLASLLWMFAPKIPLDRYFAPNAGSSQPSQTVMSNTTRDVAADFKDISAPTPPIVDNQSRDAIAICLPELSQNRNPLQLIDIISDLRNSRSSELNIEIQNLHLKTADGRELRMMISPSDSTEFRGLEAQLFSVDREGLPVFEKWPLHIDSRDLDSAKNHFLAQGNLLFSETTYTYRDTEKGITGKLVYNHDQLAAAELFKDGRFLGCSVSISSQSVACKCL